MFKTSIKKLIDLQIRQGKNSSSGSGICVRARLLVAKNANLVKYKVQNLTKSKNSIKINNKLGDLGFFTPNTKIAFTRLR